MQSYLVILPQSVRYFIRHANEEAKESTERIPAGTKLYLEPPVKANLDRRIHDAAPFMKDGQMCYVIISETGHPGLFRILSDMKHTDITKGEKQ